MPTYYHVAGPTYEAGDPLLCWDRLKALNIDPGSWKWNDAPEGFDGDCVCLFSNLADARDFAAEHVGMLLQVTLPTDEVGEDLGQYSLPWGGYIAPQTIVVDEGYLAIKDGIPAEWIKEAN